MIYIRLYESQTILYILCPRNDRSSTVGSVLKQLIWALLCSQMAHLDFLTLKHKLLLRFTLRLPQANRPPKWEPLLK